MTLIIVSLFVRKRILFFTVKLYGGNESKRQFTIQNLNQVHFINKLKIMRMNKKKKLILTDKQLFSHKFRYFRMKNQKGKLVHQLAWCKEVSFEKGLWTEWIQRQHFTIINRSLEAPVQTISSTFKKNQMSWAKISKWNRAKESKALDKN